MKVLFMGSGEFSIKVLENVLKSQHEVVAVVCQPDKIAGRGKKIVSLPIKKFATDKGLKVLQFESVNKSIEDIYEIDFDVFVTASFGQIISKDFLSRKTGLNVHPSRLPHLRGATPLQTALMNGESEIGITIQKMAWEVDSGDVAICENILVDADDNFSTLSLKSGEKGGQLLVRVLDNLQNNKQVFAEQNHKKATYTKMIRKEDGFLNFENPATKIVNKVRAIGENPGCYFTIENERIKVKKASALKSENFNQSNKEFEIGEIYHDKNNFLIKAKTDFVKIEICQAENGKVLDAKSFLNGYMFKTDRVDR